MRYFIKTFGCQMNQADSERIAGALEAAGMAAVGSMEDADVIIINTCSVRQASEDKVCGIGPKVERVKGRLSTPSQQARGRSRPPLRFERLEIKVILTGCIVGSAVGERKRTDLADLGEKLPWVDYFVPCGEGQIEEILRVLGASESSGSVKRSRSSRILPKRKKTALVPISYGCDHFCSYCVVPYARGKEKSRPFEEIVCEVERLVGGGVEEVMLLGQNVNTYGKDFKAAPQPSVASAEEGRVPLPTHESIQFYDEWFPGLLARLSGIEGLKKIEFLTSHPRNMSYEIIDAIASLPKVSKYLHLPVQSGDDGILKKMNRGYTAQEYLDLVEKIRKKVPNLRLGTDVIVGFPGETKEQFENTVKLFKKVKFDVAFIAMYSPRPGTAAAKLEDNVPKEEKRRRYKKLKEVFDDTKAVH